MDLSRCPDCGKELEPVTFSGPFAFLNQLTAYCDECAAKKTTTLEREAIKEDCKRRYFDLHKRGLITEAFRRASFSTSKREIEAMNPEAWQFARAWKRAENVYIRGTVGCGKTHMAHCMMRKAFVAGYDVAEVTARQFVKTADLFRDPRNMVEEWKAVDLLLVDDIDKATWNLDRIDALWELFNARVSAHRRTLITANVGLRDLALMLRARTADPKTDEINTSRADAALDRLKPIHQIEMKGKSLR